MSKFKFEIGDAVTCAFGHLLDPGVVINVEEEKERPYTVLWPGWPGKRTETKEKEEDLILVRR